jgi:NADH-quinone oxidoreductase subunit E
MSFHPQMPYGSGWHKSERVFAEAGPPFAFTPERRARLEEIAAQYPPDQRKSAVLAALYLAQEQHGHITGNAMRHVAEAIGCTEAEVEDVVSYYVMFFTRPVGKYVLQVCRTLSCALLGAERVTEELKKQLGVQVGETDASGTFTLQEFECLGACDRAPVVMVNNEHWHECQRPEDVGQLLEGLRTRGLAALSGCHLVKEK